MVVNRQQNSVFLMGSKLEKLGLPLHVGSFASIYQGRKEDKMLSVRIEI